MILERTNTEILVRLPLSTDLSEMQNMIDYLRYKELSTISKATQADVDLLTKSINKKILAKVMKKRGLK